MKSVKLGDVCEVIAGQSPVGSTYNNKGDGIEFHQGKKLFGENELQPSETRTTQPTKIAEPGDILISVRAPVGPVNYTDRRICIGRGLAAIRTGSEIDSSYLFHFLRMNEANINGTEGATFASINKKDIESILLPLPSLEEQRRIVARLDAAFEKISAAEVLTQQNLDNVSALQKSILHQQLKVSDNTRNYSLADAGFIQTGTTPKTSIRSYYGGDIAFIKPSDFHDDGSLNMNGQKLSASGLSVGRLIDKNSVLMVCIGATIGKVGYTDTSLSCNQQINAITLNSFEEAKYLYYIMTTDSFQEKVKSGSNQMTLPIINKTSWGNLTVDLPDLNTQKEIVTKLDDTLGKTRKLESQYQKKLAKLVDLRQSLLAEAFSTTNTV